MSVPFEKLLQCRRQLAAFRAVLAQLQGDLYGGVLRPALAGVEADDPDGVTVLSFHQVAQQGLSVAAFRLPPAKRV
ncbi:hypothetical protein QA641_14120 [Bradyrhizobium sp. CB1650]|uniref:hypothetical protein n=1 Tax=Bradyrhizobium sp. CB1650 TaxID=3039153 RepID=UPI0024351C2B|nr:hypothetical protein [Bradyrhizobium sp. CB1650]WGD54946.1 hypothetical protein QA641_14120 [Bradyrhizobium sp. CB1650]